MADAFLNPMAPSPADRLRPARPRLQVEDLSCGTVVRVMAIVQDLRDAEARTLACDTATGLWTASEGRLARSRDHHHPGKALASLQARPATAEDLQAFGIPDGVPGILGSFTGLSTSALHRDRSRAEGISASLVQLMARAVGHGLQVSPLSPTRHGFPPPQVPSVRLDVVPAPEAPGEGPPDLDRVVAFPADPNRHGPDPALSRAAAVLAAACAPLLAAFDAEAAAALGPGNWTALGHAAYAVSGTTRTRRHQAARIYPALAPALVHHDAVREAIDAGRPFEARLAEALAPLAHGRVPTRAALRRLRDLPAGTRFGDVIGAVTLAASVRVERLPPAGGWSAAGKTALAALPMLDRLGLDLDALLGRTAGGWEELAAFVQPVPMSFVNLGGGAEIVRHDLAARGDGLRGATDMARRLASTLLAPERAAAGLPPDAEADLRAAGRALFAGRSAGSITRIQDRWHRALAPFEAALPEAERLNAWPPLFPDFVAPGGLRVTCLTDDAMLRREGGHGPDADGMAGLGHCVGGYGRDCHAGLTHVASVRRDGADRSERLSTVEIVLEPGTGVPAVRQHRGAGNRPPPPEAEAAVAALAAAIASGAVPIDPTAAARRDPTGWVDGVDWSAPGIPGRTFEAWRPHLPRRLASAGLPGVRALLAAGR